MTEDSGNSEAFDPSTFDSVHLALEEVQRQYDDEERRRSAIDTKISGILGLNALLISLTASFGQTLPNPTMLLIQLLLLFSATLSFCGLVFGHTYWGKYHRPLKQVGQIYALAQDQPDEFRAYFLDKYAESVKHNRGVNDEKNEFLYYNFAITGIAIVLFLLLS